MRRSPLLLTALLLGGCFGPTAAVEPTATALLFDPPPDLPTLVCGRAPEHQVVAQHALDEVAPDQRGEIDTHKVGERTVLAAGRVGRGGFDLLDITFPTRPIQFASWDAPEGAAYFQDLKFLPDGTGVLHATTDDLTIVDLRDPLHPQAESAFRLAAPGAHMIATWAQGAGTYAALSKGEGRDLTIFSIEGAPGARTLQRLSQPLLTPMRDLPREHLFETRSHDSWFEVDSQTRVPTLWVANAFWGIVALDVTDPAAPTILTTIAHEDPFPGYAHTVQATHVDGRRLVVAVTEYGTGLLRVWDATDLASPRLLAAWHDDLPTKPNHNLQVVGTYAFVAHFHEGTYVFDLESILPADALLPGQTGRIEPVARIPPTSAPAVRVPLSPGQAYDGALDVVVQDGILWISEARTGVRSIAFGCLPAGEPAASSSG